MNQERAIKFIGYTAGVHKIRAIKEIRAFAASGLKEAKEIVDRCMAGEEPVIYAVSDKDIMVTAKHLASCGFVVQVGDEVINPNEGKPGYSFLDNASGIFVPEKIIKGGSGIGIEIFGKLKSGNIWPGDQIGIPIHERLTINDTILSVEWEGEQIILNLDFDVKDIEFQYELWDGMNVIGEELPVSRGLDNAK